MLLRALNAFFSNKTIMSVDVAEALLTIFLYNRKARKIKQSERPIPELKNLTSLTESESEVVADEWVNLAADMDTIFNVTENVKNLTTTSLNYHLSQDKFEFTNDVPDKADQYERFLDLCERNLLKEVSRSESIADAIGFQLT